MQVGDAPQAVQETLADAGAALLNAVADTAKAQVVLVQVRRDREASAETISDAATAYRQTEAKAQEALSTLLNYYAIVYEADSIDTLEPEATSSERWRT